jgi:tRNA dimethylallyltransferase
MADLAPPLIVIVGPTGAGKTALALTLCEVLHGEVVSADSRLIYRGMDIATAKPTRAEQAQVKHHLIDVVDPDQSYTLAEYQADAYSAINDIHARGRVPFLTGGTGLYVRAVVEGLQIPRVPPNPERRLAMEHEPLPQLYARLQTLDPITAAGTLPNNSRRIIRALEVIEATGKPISHQQTRKPPPYHILQIGLSLPRTILYARLDARIDGMLAAGLVDEVRGLVARGYSFDLPSMTGLGYREIGMVLRGEASLDEAVVLLKRNTRKFVRHQSNWFRPTDPRIKWFDMTDADAESQIQSQVREFLSADMG